MSEKINRKDFIKAIPGVAVCFTIPGTSNEEENTENESKLDDDQKLRLILEDGIIGCHLHMKRSEEELDKEKQKEFRESLQDYTLLELYQICRTYEKTIQSMNRLPPHLTKNLERPLHLTRK